MLDRVIDLLVGFVDLFRFWVIINPYERGVLIRLGKFKRTLEPGLSFILPFAIDDVLVDNVVPTTSDLGTQSLVTKDKQSVVISAFITWSIFDIEKALLNVESVDDVLADIATGYLADQVAENTWAQVRKSGFARSLKPRIQRHARKFGISVTNIQFADCAQSRSYRLWTE